MLQDRFLKRLYRLERLKQIADRSPGHIQETRRRSRSARSDRSCDPARISRNIWPARVTSAFDVNPSALGALFRTGLPEAEVPETGAPEAAGPAGSVLRFFDDGGAFAMLILS